MLLRCLSLLLLTSTALAATPERAVQGEHLSLSFRSSAPGNLAYQLDCLAGVIRCSQDAFQQLWKKELGWAPDDDAAVARWRIVRERNAHVFELNEEPPVTTPFPLGFKGLVLSHKMRIASFQADDWTDQRKGLSLVMPPEDATELAEIVAQFRQRFEPWWNTTAVKQLESFAANAVPVSESANLVAFLEKVAQFYAVKLATAEVVYINLIARPGAPTGGTHGEQIEDHAVIEVLPGEAVQKRLDVVAHELLHRFYARAPSATKAALMERLFGTRDPGALGAAALFDEGMATAFANGALSKRLDSPESFEKKLSTRYSFYADPYLDGLAKELLPVVETALKDRWRIDSPEFVSAYLKTAKEALGERLLAPGVVFRSLILTFDPPFARIAAQIPRALSAGSTYTASPALSDEAQGYFQRFAGVGGIILVPPKALKTLATWTDVVSPASLKELSAVRSSGAFAFGARRPSGAPVTVVVADSEAEALQLVTALLNQHSLLDGALTPAAPKGTVKAKGGR